MKRVLLILFAIVPFCLGAQNINDIYNISATYYQGTAKSMAMGNAMGAVGQDFTSLSINPAGLGLYRKATFTFTPATYTTYTTTDLNEGRGTDSKTKLSLNSFGYVGVNKSGNDIITWAFGMNRTNNFNNSIYVDAYNDNNSLVDAYFAEIIANEIYNDVELDYYSPSYIYPLWQTYLINFEQDGSLTTPVPMGGLRQRKGVNSWGGTNEWSLSTCINFSDKIYLGLSINLPYVNSRKITAYEEDFSTTTCENYWYQEESLYTTGWGFNGKLGIIAYPASWIRLGASFHTPTIYNLTDTWRTETLSSIDEYGIYATYIVPTSYFNYSMVTPWKANGSVAFIFGNFGMITADYEYVDYKSVRLSAYNYDYQSYNETLKNTFDATMNLRLGTEWRYKNYCFRGGYSFYGSPYGVLENDYRRNAVSCGFGFTKHSVTVDFAYAYTLQKHNYNLYSQYTNYYDMVAPDLIVRENTNLHNFVVTFKFRMY